MSSRSPSPFRGGRGGDLDEPSMAGLSLRRLRPYSPGRTATSMPAPSPPFPAFQFPTSEQMSYASAVRLGLPAASQTQHQEGSCSESEFELDSPPRLTIIKLPKDREPGSPTSPPPPSIDVGPAVLPTFGSDPEEWHSSDPEEWHSSAADVYFKSLDDNFTTDAYFKSLEDNFITAAKDVESALKYYNNDKNNKVKYNLISAITSCGMVDVERCYGHVNFIAKGNQQNSKEELFFAELRLDHTDVPTCVVSLEGVKKVGGLRESKYDDTYDGMDLPIDAQHCYACRSGLKHPKNGALYESGHVAYSSFYHLMS